MAADRSIIESARRGDQAAFEGIARGRIDMVFRLSVGILGSEAEAYDVAQDCMVIAWRKIKALRDPDRFHAWLLKIVVNQCRMTLRARRRLAEVPMSATDSLYYEDEQLADDAWFHVAFDRLTAQDRALLLLHHVQGRPLAELAEVLDVPVGTVKSRLFAARQALRDALKD